MLDPELVRLGMAQSAAIRAAQGLPPTVTDEVVLRRVGELLRPPGPVKRRSKRERPPRRTEAGDQQGVVVDIPSKSQGGQRE